MTTKYEWLDELVEKYDDYHECDEYHIHDGTGEHEGITPPPHDFDELQFKSQIIKKIEERERALLEEVVKEEIIKRLNDIFGLSARYYRYVPRGESPEWQFSLDGINWASAEEHDISWVNLENERLK